MNIQQLEYIEDLDTNRHFVAAAESCHVTRPPLTMQLQKLDEEVGVLLFDRSKKNGTAFHGFHYERGSIETLKSLVKKGMGYPLIPELSLKEDERACTRRFIKPEPVREISIVTHKSFNRQLLINKLKAAIQGSLPEHIVTPKEFVKIKWR